MKEHYHHRGESPHTRKEWRGRKAGRGGACCAVSGGGQGWRDRARAGMEWLRASLGTDSRSVALFRVMLALTVLGDLADRSWDLRAHYSDDGAFPRKIAVEHFTDLQWVSLHMVSGKPAVVLLLFLLHALAAVCLLVGYRSKPAAWCVWFLTNSLHCRNTIVLHAGDVYLRVALFWALFMPLSCCWSIDRALMPRSQRHHRHPDKTSEEGDWEEKDREKEMERERESPRSSSAMMCSGSLAMAAQVTIMYVSSAYHKTGTEWTTDGTATFYALHLDYFRMPLGELMLMLPHPILSFLTISVLYWEWLGCLLFFVPFNNGPVRTFAVAGFMFMHLGFALCLRLGTFFYISITGLTALLPPWFWDKVVFRYLVKPSPRRNLEIYYSDHHRSGTRSYEVFCKILGHLCLLPGTEIYPLQQLISQSYKIKELDREQDPFRTSDINNAAIVAIDCNGRVYQDYRAITAMCRVSPILWPMVWVLESMNSSTTFYRLHERCGYFLVLLKDSLISCLYGDDNSSAFDRSEAVQDASSHDHQPTSLSDGDEHSGDDDGQVDEETGRWHSQRAIGHKKVIQTRVTWRFAWELTKGLCVFWLVMLILSWNLGNLGLYQFATPGIYKPVARALHVDQSWNMFSPRPPTIDWYYIIQATLVNGSETELHRNEGMWKWQGTPLGGDWSKPWPFHQSYGNHRWLKFYEQMNSHPANQAIRLEYGRYICREWNGRHQGGAQVYEFKIWWLNEVQLLNGATEPQPKQLLWHHVCMDEKPVWPPPTPAAAPSQQ